MKSRVSFLLATFFLSFFHRQKKKKVSLKKPGQEKLLLLVELVLKFTSFKSLSLFSGAAFRDALRGTDSSSGWQKRGQTVFQTDILNNFFLPVSSNPRFFSFRLKLLPPAAKTKKKSHLIPNRGREKASRGRLKISDLEIPVD